MQSMRELLWRPFMSDEINTKTDVDGFENARNAMSHRMLHYAFKDYEPDTLTFKKLQDTRMYNEEAHLLVDNMREDRIVSGSGEDISPSPFLVYEEKDAEDSSRWLHIRLSELILSNKLNLRKFALKRIDFMAAEETISVTESLKSIIKNTHDDILKKEVGFWLPAALRLSTALDDDVLVTLHGVKQCVKSSPVNMFGFNYFLPKLLFPSRSSIESILLNPANPEEEHKQISQLLDDFVRDASSLQDLCESYFLKLGHLPLAPEFSLAEAVRKWALHNEGENIWKEVWDWAQKQSIPTANYHACCVFILLPQFILAEGLNFLWEKIVKVVYVSSSIARSQPESVRWGIVNDLVLNYTFLLESIFPDTKGALIINIAWWLATRVATLFTNIIEEDLLRFREDWIKPALNRSRNMWIVACPRIENSDLYNATHTMPLPWGLALISVMSVCKKFNALLPFEQPNEIKDKFHDGLTSSLITLLPIPIEMKKEKATFAFEMPIVSLVCEWSKGQIAEKRNELDELIQASNALDSREKICSELRDCSKSTSTNQDLTAIALKTIAYRDPEIASGIWSIISNKDWRFEFFKNVPNKVLDIFLNVLTVLQVKSEGDWLSYLPHYLAEQCEIEDDEKKREKLFLYLIFMSYASDSISAIQRLLRGEQKAKYVSIVEKHRKSIEANCFQYAPWVSGKMRAMLAGLYIE